MRPCSVDIPALFSFEGRQRRCECNETEKRGARGNCAQDVTYERRQKGKKYFEVKTLSALVINFNL